MQTSQEKNRVSAPLASSARNAKVALVGLCLMVYSNIASANVVENFLRSVSSWLKSGAGIALASVIGAGFAVGLMIGKVRIWQFVTYLIGIMFFFGAEGVINVIKGWSGGS